MLAYLLRCGHGADRISFVTYGELNRAALPKEEERFGHNLRAAVDVGDAIVLKPWR